MPRRVRFRPTENAHDILGMPGSEAEVCLAMLRYGVAGFINGDLNAELEGERRRKEHARYFHPDLGRIASPRLAGADENMTNYAMQRRLDEANQTDNNILRRRRRG